MAEVTRYDQPQRAADVVEGSVLGELSPTFHVYSYCPEDASTPAREVHLHLEIPHPRGPEHGPPIRLVCRFHGPNGLDALIEALLENRFYVFGVAQPRLDWPVQPDGPQPGRG